MKNRTHLYINRKNIFVWIMALCMAASVIARIIVPDKSNRVWVMTVLPIAASILYTLIVLLDSRERFYKTAIPVWMMVGYGCIWINSNVSSRMMVWLFWLAFCLVAYLYTDIVSGRWPHAVWSLLVVLLIPMGFLLYFYRNPLLMGDTAWMLTFLPDALMLLGVFITVFAIHIDPVGEYHPTWGDRTDGRRLRSQPPMDQMSPYIMVNRNESSNLFEESLEITQVDKYIRQKRREGLTGFGITHVLLATYVRCLCRYPGLNRFLSGQKVYSRGDDIQYCMTIKKEMKNNAPETVIKVHLNPRDTAKDVYEKLQAAVEEGKKPALDSGFDNTAGLLAMIPGVVLKFVVWLLKVLDYFGMLPPFLLEVSPFHGSLFFTSMGSLGIPPIYHHLYDFGNLPVFGAFGMKRRATEVLEDGSVVQRKYVDVKFTLDERIVDGYYYAAFFKHYKRLLMHPEILDNPPDEVVEDID